MQDKAITIEKEVGLKLIELMESGKITIERSSEIAFDINRIVKESNQEDVLKKLSDYIQTTKELTRINLAYGN